MMLLAAALMGAALLPGTYTNEEQVYFAREAGKPVPPWTGLRITRAGDAYRAEPVDAFGAVVGGGEMWRVTEGKEILSITSGGCTREMARVPLGLTIVNRTGRCDGTAGLTTVTQAGMAVAARDGSVLEMQRSRAFTCWASIPRRAKKPDGTDDWWFRQGLVLHDAGGRVRAATDEAEPQAYTLRMRNVVWPSGDNKPSLVLYVHGADPDHAIAYGWADPLATRVGINIRTVQASCTLAEPKS